MGLQVFIINRNRLTTTRAMVEWLLRFDTEPLILDNGSTYPPLLEWYRNCPADVIRFNDNYGFGVGWDTGILGTVARDDFVLSDADLDLSGIPDDWLQVLRRGLDRHGRQKAGFSLEIDDLPDHYLLKKPVQDWESRFWRHRLDDEFFDAGVDTTFALCRHRTAKHRPGADGVRAARPYTARHVPWYIDVANMSEEELHYAQHATGSSSWTSRLRQELLTRAILPAPA